MFRSNITTTRRTRLPRNPRKSPPFSRQINRLKKLIGSGKKKNKWHWNRHGEQRKKLPRHKTRQSSREIGRQLGGISRAWRQRVGSRSVPEGASVRDRS